MTRYFKATRLDGTDFHSGTVDYAAALASGETLTHPDGRRHSPWASHHFSVAAVPTDCTGMRWPCRLFAIEPVGDAWTPTPGSMPNKRACLALRVVEERPAVEALGPQGTHLVDLIGQAARLTDQHLAAAWAVARVAAVDADWGGAVDAALDAARGAARGAAEAAAGVAGGVAAWGAAVDAAWGLVVRDLIGDDFTQDHYDTLTGPWRKVIGPIHPDDTDLRGAPDVTR